MGMVGAFWLATMVAVWFLIVGAIRLLAYRAGTDHTPGMGRVAKLALSLGAVAAVVALVLGVWLVTSR